MSFLFKRENTSVTLVEPDCEKLYQCLRHCDFTKKIEVDILPSSPLYPMIEILNRVISERQAAASATLADLDGTVQTLTSMTVIRQMLIQIEEQTTQLESLSAQAEELGATANEVASSATNSSAFVEGAMTAVVSGGEKIQQAIQFVERSFDEFAKVSRQVQEVLNSMQEIEEIVGVIAGVADQTNLLALNAAIEAARAAEYGRGFAVVADEVRKLAENTKTSVNDIGQKIAGLSQSSMDTSKNISSLSQTMQSGKTVMQDAAESLKGIIQNFDSITQDIHNIAASSEEQSAAVQESASSVATVAQAAEKINDIAKVTGQGIYDISQALQKIRIEQIQRVPTLDAYQALELYKTDHLLWTWRVYNLVLGFEHLKSSEVGNHHECRLGLWLGSSESEKCRSLPAFIQLEAPHKQVHDLAREAALAIEQGDAAKAEKILAQMAQASQEVVNILTQLQNECRN